MTVIANVHLPGLFISPQLTLHSSNGTANRSPSCTSHLFIPHVLQISSLSSFAFRSRTISTAFMTKFPEEEMCKSQKTVFPPKHFASLSQSHLSPSQPPTPESLSSPRSSPSPSPSPQSLCIEDESLSLLEWPAISARILRHASTDLGRMKLVDPMLPSQLIIPCNQQQSEALLQQTREFYHLEHNLSSPLSFAPARDVRPIADQASKGRVLSPADLLSIAQTLNVARTMRRQIIDANEENVPSLQALVSPMKTAVTAEREIFRHIDNHGDVIETADPELGSIRSNIRSATAEARRILSSLMSRHSDAIQDRVITTRYDRYVIPVKMSHKSTFRSGIIHDASSSGSTAFMEPPVVRSINDRLRQLAAREKAAILAILRRLSEDIVAPIAKDLDIVCDVLADLDAAATRARASVSLSAVDVVFDNERPLCIPGVRHPLLLYAAQDSARQSDNQQSDWKDTVVPSSYELPPDVRCVCVTGPNTGGKTLSLKTLGLAVLMAKAGLFVTATIPRLLDTDKVSFQDERRVRIPFFDKVLADIGDDQSLVQSLSTFSGHVRRIKRILATTTSKSLVLLDEIGSGTDPAEGAALGTAVLRHLAIGKRASLTFATTHHGELKMMKYSNDGHGSLFENASVEFDDVAMKPTFRLVWGIPGRSNALAIAERLGLDAMLIEEAKDLLSRGNSSSDTNDGGSPRVDFENMISRLEQDKLAAESARVEAERSLQDIDLAREELSRRLDKLKENETQLRAEQETAMNAELTTARKAIAKVIRDMQHGGGSAQAAGQASNLINVIERRKLGKQNGATRKPDGAGRKRVSNDDIGIGDHVLVESLGDGEVVVVEKLGRSEVMVGVGAMRAKVKIRDILSVRRSPIRAVAPTRTQSQFGDSVKKQLTLRTAANSLDIRGKRVDSAIVEVEQAMDRAIPYGALWIIHGHGTGRLRTGIRNFLSDNPLVDHVEDADQTDGGSGVTIAHLS